MFQTKFVEAKKTHILCSITFFSNVMPFMRYEKNMVEPDKPQIKI